ncbi:MAG: carboxypeptidase-like regulatory domain-containing protein [Balneolaceae bacterium]|nr:carboxypeptidase-like regulatory domain-containing protein [Balneolaceae bacterium]
MSNIPVQKRVTYASKQVTINQALWTVLEGTGLHFAISSNRHLVVYNLMETPSKTDQVQTGTITGQVTVESSGESLPGANVFLEGTQKGATTDTDGNYMLTGIEPGSYTLVARFIGFQSFEQEVEIEADQTLTVNIQLAEQVAGLDEVVVTGTAGQARRREVGNSISSVDMETMTSVPVSTEQALQAQVPGLSVTSTSGSIGAGSQIRIRGNVSVSMSNQPLIYLDGIRLRSEPYPENVPPVGYNGRGANYNATPLNDINPADISNVEIIKGAAATTLYGSEAAAGVIQIFTKMGTPSGEPIWSARIDQGANWTPKFGAEGADYLFLDPWLKTAHTQQYSLSVRGGAEQTQYFVSGSFADNEGVLPLDSETKINGRANFRTFLAEDLILRINTGYTRHDIWNTPSGNNAQGLTLNAYRRDRNYIGSAAKEDIDQFLQYDINTVNDRFISGASLNFDQTSSLTHQVQLGFDFANSELWQFRPVGFPGAEDGIRSNIRWTYTSLTLDYLGTVEFDITPEFSADLSWGGETITTNENRTTGYGDGFPGPGDHLVTAAANRLSFEEQIKIVTGGVFSQLLLDYKDRYFLTLGFRLDGNSAFGENLGLQPYRQSQLVVCAFG